MAKKKLLPLAEARPSAEDLVKEYEVKLRKELSTFLRAPHRRNRFALDQEASSYSGHWTDMMAERNDKVKKRKKK